ncbi:MAG: restriction endonuclease subunit S [Prevotella sp.]|jgi:type I restriction enzyme S subunit
MTANKTKWVRLGDCIEPCDERNSEGIKYPFYGLNKDKTFMPTVADTNGLDNTKYKIVRKGFFVFSGMQTGRDECIRLGLYREESPIIVSPAYTTFNVKDITKLLPEYVFIYFSRDEMDRYGWFLSDGSIRSNLDWDRFCDIRIPLPPLEVQQSIVNVYHCMEEARRIAEAARDELRTLCPALVQKAINS